MKKGDSLDSENRDSLEDSLSYSPLKDMTNKENSPAIFFKGFDRTRQSPSTSRLFSGAGLKNNPILASPDDKRPTPKRLNDFWDTPDKSRIDVATSSESSKSLMELTSEIASLRSSLALIQKDCDFHRNRAVEAHDQMNYLNKLVRILEEENKKTRLSISDRTSCKEDDHEKAQLRLSIGSMESLNRSLARQNDLLRSRTSVTGRFAKKDIRVQTDELSLRSIGTDPVDPACNHPFLSTPSHAGWSPFNLQNKSMSPLISLNAKSRILQDSGIQTETGVWATVEDITESFPKREDLQVPGLKQRRKSLPSYYSSYPVSPQPQMSKPSPSERRTVIVPKPLLAPVMRTNRQIQEPASVMNSTREYLNRFHDIGGNSVINPAHPAGASYVFIPRKPNCSLFTLRRGKSTGSVKQRPRWIP
jgi:hypothetical protein